MGWRYQTLSKYEGVRLCPMMVSYGMTLLIIKNLFLRVTVTHKTEIILWKRKQIYFHFVEIQRISLKFYWTQLINAVFFIYNAKDKFPALTYHRQFYNETKSTWLHTKAVLYNRPSAKTLFCSLKLVNLALLDTNQHDEALHNLNPLLNIIQVIKLQRIGSVGHVAHIKK